MFIFYAVMQLVNFSNIKCDILKLKGDNYEVWKEIILLYLGCMDIDYAIRKDKPTITNTSTTAKKALCEQWERSNRLSVMFIKSLFSYNAGVSNGRLVFLDSIINVHAPQMKENYFLPNLIVIISIWECHILYQRNSQVT